MAAAALAVATKEATDKDSNWLIERKVYDGRRYP